MGPLSALLKIQETSNLGAWGPAIFSDDTASDVRDDFRQYVGDGLSSEEAVEKLETEYHPDPKDLEEYCPFWLGLAAAQFQVGRLTDKVKETALGIIQEELDLEVWKESADIGRRKAALAMLSDQLTGPQKSPTKIKKKYIAKCEWPVGSLVSYELLSGSYIVFRVGAIHCDKGGDYPELEVLDWKGKHNPTEQDVGSASVLRQTFGPGGSRLLVCRSSERGFPGNRLQVIKLGDGNKPQWSAPLVTNWKTLDKDLLELYSLE